MKRLNTVWVVLTFFVSACFYPADRGRALEAKVDKLQSDFGTELQSQTRKLEATLPRVEEKIQQVTQALDSLEKGSRRSSADIGVQLQKTIEDVSSLRGQVETYLHKLTELETALKQTQEDSDRRLAELKGSDSYKLAEARKKAEELAKNSDKKEFLALAGQRADAGDTAVARVLYSDFMKKWPKDELVGEAHFGLGETYYSDDKCREALFEFGKVVQDHPKSRRAPEALLRSSDCFAKLKMVEESRLALEELIKSYPKSGAAQKARSKLEELKKKSAGKKAARR
jgi:tol-pal system protein YbgF